MQALEAAAGEEVVVEEEVHEPQQEALVERSKEAED